MTNTPTTPASVASRLTVEDIVREMRERENLDGGEMVDNFNIDLGEYGEFDGLKLIKAYADAIESAWRIEKAGLERKVADALTTGAFVAEESARKQKSEVAKERDDLKKSKTNIMFDARLDNECATVKRLEAAERCIEDVENDLKQSLFLDDEHSPAAKSALSIIRAYRDQKEVEK